MAPKLIYCGSDNSHRLSVLRSAGYTVENCGSASDLGSFLAPGAEILVILFSDEEKETLPEMIDTARACCSAPLAVFRHSSNIQDDIGYDLVIPNLTPPNEWLHDIASLIQRRQMERERHSASPSKATPTGAIPDKIKRFERHSAPTDADLRSFGQPPEESPGRPGNNGDSRYLV